jgi:dipeptide/tripeptide permease
MKPKQLANLLIRLLGLSLCAHSIAPIVNGLIATATAPPSYGAGYRSSMWYYIASGLIPAVIGIFFILRSRWVTEKLFKDEAE